MENSSTAVSCQDRLSSQNRQSMFFPNLDSQNYVSEAFVNLNALLDCESGKFVSEVVGSSFQRFITEYLNLRSISFKVLDTSPSYLKPDSTAFINKCKHLTLDKAVIAVYLRCISICARGLQKDVESLCSTALFKMSQLSSLFFIFGDSNHRVASSILDFILKYEFATRRKKLDDMEERSVAEKGRGGGEEGCSILEGISSFISDFNSELIEIIGIKTKLSDTSAKEENKHASPTGARRGKIPVLSISKGKARQAKKVSKDISEMKLFTSFRALNLHKGTGIGTLATFSLEDISVLIDSLKTNLYTLSLIVSALFEGDKMSSSVSLSFNSWSFGCEKDCHLLHVTFSQDLLGSLLKIYEELIPSIDSILLATRGDVESENSTVEVEVLSDTKNMLNATFFCKRRIIRMLSVLTFSAARWCGMKMDASLMQEKKEKYVEWIEILQRLSTAGIPDDESGNYFTSSGAENHGALLTDTCRVYPARMRESLSALQSDRDAEEIDYLWGVILSNRGTLKPPSGDQFKQPPLSALNTSSGTALAKISSDQDAIESIKNIFPDYGEGFIIAVLQAFEGDAERSIDALLTENLPPKLAKMDRTIVALWIGKGGAQQGKAVAASSSSEGINYLLPEDRKFKEIQMEKIKALERERELDNYVWEKEYKDEYDDQFDEPAPYSVSQGTHVGSDATDSKTKSKSKRSQNAPQIDWRVNMDQMKRLNRIIMNDEAEEKYWASMRNTNHEKGKSALQKKWTDEGNDEEDEPGKGEIIANAIPRATNLIPNSNRKEKTQVSSIVKGGGSKSNENSLGDGSGKMASVAADNAHKTVKFRTKTFDKHHQKEKSNRKFGSFY